MCKTRHVAVMLTSILFHQWTKWSCCVPNTPIVPSTSTYDIPNASTPLGAPARPPSGISLSLIFTMLSLPSGKFFSNMAAWASMLGPSWLWIHCGKECQILCGQRSPRHIVPLVIVAVVGATFCRELAELIHPPCGCVLAHVAVMLTNLLLDPHQRG